MKNSNFNRLLRIVFILVFGLSVSLVLHIYLIKQSKAQQRVFAMGRIDFIPSTQSENLKDIRDFTATIPGISNAIYNAKDRILVFMYEPKIVNTDVVLNKIKLHSKANAIKYKSSANELNSGCPINYRKTSIFGKAMALISLN
jgi:hypothetical protein